MTKAAVLAQMGNQNQTFRNRIINGSMLVDQRGTAATPITTNSADNYIVDRFTIVNSAATGKFTSGQNQGGVSAPTGFTKYLGITSASAYSPVAAQQNCLYHRIEGLNIPDLGFGTTTASTVALSFWVRSSLTGTFSVGLVNLDGTRAYVTTYTINNANTWEYKTITVPGCTDGSWVIQNQTTLQIRWDLGSGSNFNATSTNAWVTGSDVTRTSGSVSVCATNGATFYITGVQLEAGTTATPFEQRLYGTELALCQRYYFKTPDAYSWAITTGNYGGYQFKVSMRAKPTVTLTPGGAGTVSDVQSNTEGIYCSASTTMAVNVLATAEL